MASSKKMSSNNCDNDGQPEVAMWPPKPEILISLELWETASKFQRQTWGFRPRHVQRKCLQMFATTTDNLKSYVAAQTGWLYCNFSLKGEKHGAAQPGRILPRSPSRSPIETWNWSTRNWWLDQIRMDAGVSPTELWRRAVRRGHGAGVTQWPPQDTRSWWWWRCVYEINMNSYILKQRNWANSFRRTMCIVSSLFIQDTCIEIEAWGHCVVMHGMSGLCTVW